MEAQAKALAAADDPHGADDRSLFSDSHPHHTHDPNHPQDDDQHTVITINPAAEEDARHQRQQTKYAIKILLVLQYLHLLDLTQNLMAQKQALPLKHLLYDAFYEGLQEEEQTRLWQIAPTSIASVLTAGGDLHPHERYFWNGILVFPLKDFAPKPLLERTLQEVRIIREAEARSRQLETAGDVDDAMSSVASAHDAQEKDAASIASLHEGDDEDQSSVTTKDSKLLRAEKRQRYEAQRKKDAARRQEVAKQRKFLYNLIQTDQISEIFARKAAASTTSSTAVSNTSRQATGAPGSDLQQQTQQAVYEEETGDPLDAIERQFTDLATAAAISAASASAAASAVSTKTTTTVSKSVKKKSGRHVQVLPPPSSEEEAGDRLQQDTARHSVAETTYTTVSNLTDPFDR